MGVKVDINLNDIKPFFDVKKIEKSIDGVRDSVFFLDNKYILKVFENSSNEAINNEIKLLKILNNLNVPKIIKEPFVIKNKLAIIYSKIEGTSLKKCTINDIEKISTFMKQFHSKTKGLKNSNLNLFDKNRVRDLILKTNNIFLLEKFDNIKINLKDDGIIHGDLFKDNAKFLDNNLSGVYDFIEACNGDFLFDLAVVAISWCFDDSLDYKKLDILINTYDNSIDKNIFKEYMKYALIYYATTRLIYDRDYDDLIYKLKSLDE